jgi:hypothetical protein
MAMAPYYDYDSTTTGLGLACAGGTSLRECDGGTWWARGRKLNGWVVERPAVVSGSSNCSVDPLCMHACICVGSRTAEMSGPTHRHS